jgi:hypothetical protein
LTLVLRSSNWAASILENRGRFLVLLLRAMAIIDVAAALAVIAPRAWIATSHQLLGLGEFPDSPIAGYLARSTSIWYVLFGMLLWFVSNDIKRYSVLITWLAWMMIAQGVMILGVDVIEGMPIWWTTLEGPCSSLLGVGILMTQRWTLRPSESGAG